MISDITITAITEKELGESLEGIIKEKFFLDRLRDLRPNLDFEKIKEANEVAMKYHKGQFRLTGHNYIIHTQQTTLIAAEYGRDYFDTYVAIASLLHDIKEKTKIKKKEIIKKFGNNIHYLIDGVTEKRYFFDRLKRKMYNLNEIKGDPILILIRMADRYSNMLTINVHEVEKQLKIAKETKDYLSPIGKQYFPELADRLDELCMN